MKRTLPIPPETWEAKYDTFVRKFSKRKEAELLVAGLRERAITAITRDRGVGAKPRFEVCVEGKHHIRAHMAMSTFLEAQKRERQQVHRILTAPRHTPAAETEPADIEMTVKFSMSSVKARKLMREVLEAYVNEVCSRLEAEGIRLTYRLTESEG